MTARVAPESSALRRGIWYGRGANLWGSVSVAEVNYFYVFNNDLYAAIITEARYHKLVAVPFCAMRLLYRLSKDIKPFLAPGALVH